MSEMSTAEAIVTMFADKQGFIRLSMSNQFGQHTKHIYVRYHLIRDMWEKEIIKLQYCPSGEMTANIFTKPLSKEMFCHCIEQLGLWDK